MAIQYRGTGTSGNSGSTTVTSQAITLPTGWQPGDILFTVLRVGSSAVTGFSQTGGTGTWTIDFSAADGVANLFYAFAHRVMAAGDTAPTFGWTTASSTCWSCGGFSSSTGAALVLDKWATGDPLIVNTAATTATPHSVTAAGGSEASIILTCCRASAAGSATSHTYTPPSGWTWNDGDGSFFASGLNARFAANVYQLGVSGTVTPGAETLTDSTSDNFFWIVAHALVQEAVLPPRPPGSVTPRPPHRARLGRPGACAAGILAAATVVSAVQGYHAAMPPMTWMGGPGTRPAVHRAVAKGVLAKTTLAPVPSSVPPARPGPAIAHLPPHRAQFRKLTAPASLAFSTAKLPPTAVSPRPPHRGVAKGVLAKTSLAPVPASVSVLPQPAPVRRPGPHRALAKGVLAVPAPAAVAAPAPASRPPPVTNRPPGPHRAVARGVLAKTTLAPVPSRVPPPQWRQPNAPRPAHRAAWRAAAGPPPLPPLFTIGALSASVTPGGALTAAGTPQAPMTAASASATLTAFSAPGASTAAGLQDQAGALILDEAGSNVT